MNTQPIILLVACKPSTRILLETFLSCRGLQVFTAMNVNSALLQLRVMHPDLIILDGCEIGDTYREAVLQIKQLSSAAVLLLHDVADAQQDSMQEAVLCAPAEGDSYLVYPLNIADLGMQVTNMLQELRGLFR